ncbi:40S ribosomal protein S5-1 [Hordeum vulgare]|nr:40S ribosomal protein S5-1 [Hordeum vulgare]
MREGMLHIRDVEGPKKTGSVEARLEAMEQQVFKCQGTMERGLNTNHMMITEFTSKHRIDANDIGKHLTRLYDRIDHLQAQIYDLQNQNWEIKELKAQVTSFKKDLEKSHEGMSTLNNILCGQNSPNDKGGIGFNSKNKKKSKSFKKKGKKQVKNLAKIVCFKCKIEAMLDLAH